MGVLPSHHLNRQCKGMSGLCLNQSIFPMRWADFITLNAKSIKQCDIRDRLQYCTKHILRCLKNNVKNQYPSVYLEIFISAIII